MSFGPQPSSKSIIKSDTAPLYAYVYNEDESGITQADVASVAFTIVKPDNSRTTVTGSVDSSGTGYYNWTDTSQTGTYKWLAQFTFTSGEKRSITDEFEVYDPLDTPPSTQVTQIAEEVWMRLEDCFDSDEGGPWLRKQTLAYFDKSKVARFIPEGLLMVNAYPPITQLALADFTTPTPEVDPAILALDPDATVADPERIIIVEATLLAVIRHLMRSYVEQPLPQGANVVWQNRRDYQQRWAEIFAIENEYFKTLLALWKRSFLNYGKGSLLIHSKAGRLYGPGYNRAWGAGRGGWR